jgi:TetR/AcrR family transcriptional regulator, transcriptional repressor for nem operon
MRSSAEVAAQNHDRILQSAARLFRERGLDRVTVAEIMGAAGLTHGGFYAHFKSKDDLIAASAARSLDEFDRQIDLATSASADPVRWFVDRYLSPAHRDNPGRGCALVALGGELTRQDGATRTGVTARLRVLLDQLATRFSWRKAEPPRAQAIQLVSSLIGGLLLARLVDDAALSDEILRTVAAGLIQRDAGQPVT